MLPQLWGAVTSAARSALWLYSATSETKAPSPLHSAGTLHEALSILTGSAAIWKRFTTTLRHGDFIRQVHVLNSV